MISEELINSIILEDDKLKAQLKAKILEALGKIDTTVLSNAFTEILADYVNNYEFYDVGLEDVIDPVLRELVKKAIQNMGA